MPRNIKFPAGVVLVIAVFAGLAQAEPPHAPWFPQAAALPEPVGAVLRVRDVAELFQAVETVPAGGTILLAAGRYLLPRYLEIATDNVTLRGESGDRNKVILDGVQSRHGELVGVGNCAGVTIADLTIQNAKWNGFKINSNRGSQRVTLYNCVIHNIWQRGVKGPAVPKRPGGPAAPQACRIQYCLFYNDRPKRFSDDETDTTESFNGNYIGGIDVMNSLDWVISDNVFLGINGRTGEGRACIFVWQNAVRCLIERNIFVDCDHAVALGNPHRGDWPVHATGCTVRDNLIVRCPETGILACHTRDCRIEKNTIFDPQSRLGRLIRVLNTNEGLQVSDNLLMGPPPRINSDSRIVRRNNVVRKGLANDVAEGVGQHFLSADAVAQAVKFESGTGQDAGAVPPAAQQQESAQPRLEPKLPSWTPPMRKVHAGFQGQPGYIAQFGDSITYSMAFWSPMGWDNPDQYLSQEDGLPKKPNVGRWRDVIRGASDKGPKFANYSGWRVGQVLQAMDEVLQREKPEAAIVMVGSNDISGGRLPESYRQQLRQVIRKCLDAHCVPILNTIPPRRGLEDAVNQANSVIRDVAENSKIPLVDFHSECLRLRPGATWDGTLISEDGVHPTGGKSNVYTPENMKDCGYALRNWLNFLAVRQVYFHVLETSATPKPADSISPRPGLESPPIPRSEVPCFPVYAPRVVSPYVADAYSMKTFARFHGWDDLRGDRRALEVYRYLVDSRTGLFHMNVVQEGADDLGEYSQVRDPVKIINVYGYGYCGIFGPTVAGICEQMGIGPGRTITLPGWSHVAAETFYDGGWHYLDVDVRAVFRADDGRLASLEEARKNAALWRDRGPLFFPNDPLDATRKAYQQSRVEYYHGFQQHGHTMDYVLRPGERFIRWWRPQGGRWHHLPLYHETPWLRTLLESAPRGPKPNHRHFSLHNHGNGRFLYQPNLTDKSTDFERGAYDRRNVAPAADGLTLAKQGEGFAIFEVRTPYVIVPLVGKMETTDDDREASVVEIDADGASLSLSTDNGKTWIALPAASIHDLTPYVSGRYGYLLRISLSGSAGRAVVRSLKLCTWVQLAPASLPTLRRGRNRMQFWTGDHYGLNTRVLEVRSQANQRESVLKHALEPPRDYDPNRRTERIRGQLTVQLSAPPGTRIAWFTSTGQFRAHQGQAAEKTHNAMAYATERPENFQTIYEAKVPSYTSHWHYNASRDVRLEQAAEKLYVRYTGDPALNNFAIHAHCQDQRAAQSPIQITHVWSEAGQRRIKTIDLVGRGNYTIETAAEPENESIELAVPSS